MHGDLEHPCDSEQLRRSVFIVEPNMSRGDELKRLFEAMGQDVVLVPTFTEARRLLTDLVPDVLITHVRLGAYNGLHLVLRTRIKCPNCVTIVTADAPDPVLEAEARRQGALFLVQPFSDAVLLNSIKSQRIVAS